MRTDKSARTPSKPRHWLTGERLRGLHDLVRRLYVADARPWVVGYSGGKDSTATLQVIWHAIAQLSEEERTKPIYVISSDTLVETPVIVNYLTKSLVRISEASKAQHMPFQVQRVVPEINDTFWVNMIGRGYPAPYNRFRWCTDRMKIRPATRFIHDKVTDHGEVIVALGARRAESATRAQTMSHRKAVGDHLSRHSNIPNAWVFTPIEEWQTDDVWTFLLSSPSPWEADNNELVTMYRNAQDGECPLVIDKSTLSCGNSRFGCWVCTVVDRDRAMEAMVDGGAEWMEPMLELRDWLCTTQDPAVKHKYRDVRRRAGHVQFGDKDGKKRLIWGPYKFEFRQEILRRVLQAQQVARANGPEAELQLITRDELLKIRRIWASEEGDWQDSVAQIYETCTGEPLNAAHDDWSALGEAEQRILEDVCKEHGVPTKLLTELFAAERQEHGMSRRSGIFDSLHQVLCKEWRPTDEVLAKAGFTADGVQEED